MTAVTQQYMTDNSYRYFRIFMLESQGIYLGTEWWRKYYMTLNELELISNNQNILRSTQYTSTITTGTTSIDSPNVSVIKDGDISANSSKTGTIWKNDYSSTANQENIWIQIELNVGVKIEKIRMYHHSFSEWEFLGSNDGINWNRVYYKQEELKGDSNFFKWNEYDLTLTPLGVKKGLLSWDPSRNGYVGEFNIDENGCSEEFIYQLGSFVGDVNIQILDVDSQYVNTSKTINVIDCVFYKLTASPPTVLEGGSVDITLETDAGAGVYDYIISGQGIAPSDITQGLSGSFLVDDTGKSVITLNIPDDFEIEPDETFTLELTNGKSSVDVTIIDIYYTLSVTPSIVDEGETVDIILDTNAPDGTCQYSIETIGDFNSDDFIENTPLNGFISFTNGKGKISLTLKEDLIIEGPESFIFKLVGCGDEPSVTVTVGDESNSPVAYVLEKTPPSSIGGGGAVGITIKTNGPDGICSYSLTGSSGFSITDHLDGNISETGTITIEDGVGNISFKIKDDYISETQESFTFKLVGCGDEPSITIDIDPETSDSTEDPTTPNNLIKSGSTGRSLSISGDGKVLATGAFNAQENNNISIYDNIDGEWVYRGRVLDDNNKIEPLYADGGDSFSHFATDKGTVSLSGDGKILVVAAPYWSDRSDGSWGGKYSTNVREGAVFTYHWNENTKSWDYVCVTRSSFALSYAYNPPEPIIYQNHPPEIQLVDSVSYATSVDISYDGMRMIIGSPGHKIDENVYRHDSVYIYDWNESNQSWDEKSIIYSPKTNNGTIEWSTYDGFYKESTVQETCKFGNAVAISGDGQKIVVGAPSWCPSDLRDPNLDRQYMYDKWGIGDETYSLSKSVGYSGPNGSARGVVFSFEISNDQWVLQQQQIHQWKLDPDYFTNFPVIKGNYESGPQNILGGGGKIWAGNFGSSLSLDYEGNTLVVGMSEFPSNLLAQGYYSKVGRIGIFKRSSSGSWTHELPFNIENTGYDPVEKELTGDRYLDGGAHLNFYENDYNIYNPPDYEQICKDNKCWDYESNRSTGNLTQFREEYDSNSNYNDPSSYPYCAYKRSYGYDVSYSSSSKRLVINCKNDYLLQETEPSQGECASLGSTPIFTLYLNTENSNIELSNTVEDYWNQGDLFEWVDNNVNFDDGQN